MKITQNMLKKWIDIPNDIQSLTNQKIVEVETFSKACQATNLVIGHVLTCDKHPNSDHLSLTTVDIGSSVEQIICGASNVAKGQYVIVATIGTILFGDFKIKPVKIRGIESNGMICSLKELGLEDKFISAEFLDGIFYFDKPQKIGSDALAALSLDGWVMELGLTPNRSDLLSVLGFSYDLAAMTNKKITQPKYNIKETNNKNPVSIKIQTKGCGRYYARKIEELTIKESPWWIKAALISANIKPVNNVVDISNYVLLEYGTPLHMFDAKKVETNAISVRYAKQGEKVTTLDEIKRVLNEKDVVITNEKEVIAIGGVMGLQNTVIDDNTTSVIIEAAYFEPSHIRQTSKRLNLRSDASLRFERGVDDQRVMQGLERATELLIELADAKVSLGVSSTLNFEVENPEIRIPKNYFNKVLGVEIDEQKIISYFKSYNYTYESNHDGYVVKAPSYRNDIMIKADVLEEIARIYGLDNISMAPIAKQAFGKLTFKQKRVRALRHKLADFGLNEIVTYTLIKQENVHLYNNIGKPVSILMPLSEDKKTLRQSLIHGLLETIKYNQARQQPDISLFEIGNCFAGNIENMHLGIALSGSFTSNKWEKQKILSDFYVLKGIIDKVFNELGVFFEYSFAEHSKAFHPYRQANISYMGKVIGQIAEIHPLEAKHLDIAKTVALDINLSLLLKEKQMSSYKAISRYPNVDRDLAVVVDEGVDVYDLVLEIKKSAQNNLVKLDVFDVYQGENIATGKKSVAFSLSFNNVEKTLKSEDIDHLMKRIIKRLNYSHQAVVRD